MQVENLDGDIALPFAQDGSCSGRAKCRLGTRIVRIALSFAQDVIALRTGKM